MICWTGSVSRKAYDMILCPCSRASATYRGKVFDGTDGETARNDPQGFSLWDDGDAACAAEQLSFF